MQLKEELDLTGGMIDEARASGSIAECLVVRCFATEVVFGRVVPQKGIDEDGLATTMLLRDIGWLGTPGLLLRQTTNRRSRPLLNKRQG